MGGLRRLFFYVTVVRTLSRYGTTFPSTRALCMLARAEYGTTGTGTTGTFGLPLSAPLPRRQRQRSMYGHELFYLFRTSTHVCIERVMLPRMRDCGSEMQGSQQSVAGE